MAAVAAILNDSVAAEFKVGGLEKGGPSVFSILAYSKLELMSTSASFGV